MLKISKRKKKKAHKNNAEEFYYNKENNKENDKEKEESEGEDSENGGSEGYSGFSLEDLQDIELLQIKANATLLVMWGFIFEYFATVGEIQAIITKIQFENSSQDENSENNDDSESNEDDNEESSYADLEPDYYVSLNADATSVSAFTLALYGQTILVNVVGERYRRYLIHSAKRKLSVTKSANRELYISVLLEAAAFLFGLAGASNIYNIKLNYPYLDED